MRVSRLFLTAIVLIGCTPDAGATDRAPLAACFESSARDHGVSAAILYLIAMQESGLRTGITHNKNGTFDIYPMGINSLHLPKLRALGLDVQQMLDPCQNIEAGAARLSWAVSKYGNTWQAVGAYHSETPSRRDAYALRICRRFVHEFPDLARQTPTPVGCVR
jgi:hypothetical protein